MTNDPSQHAAGIDQATADATVRLLWVAFNNVGLYGAAHPLTAQAIAAFHGFLSQHLPRLSSIVIHLQQDSLFCEELRIDKRNYGGRLITRFMDAGIQSLSFHADGAMTEAGLQRFVDILSNAKAFPSVDQMTAELARDKAGGIRFNFVHYQKVLGDQTVVGKNFGEVAQALSRAEAAGEARDEGAFAPSGADSLSSHIADRVSRLRQYVRGDAPGQAAASLSSDEIVATLAALTRDVSERIRVESAQGAIMDHHEKTLDEMEQLTCDAIVRIAREEFLSAKISAKRLAHIIHRLVPDSGDLKKILPKLRENLLAAGMSDKDYLALMENLASTLQEEGLTDLLKQAGDAAGVTVGEIVKDLKKNPQAAVGLILLASEIQSMMGFDKEQLQSFLGDSIESLTAEVAAAKKTGASAADIAAIRQTFSALRQNVLDRLKQGGAHPELIGEMSDRLNRAIARETTEVGPTGEPASAAKAPNGAPENAVEAAAKRPQTDGTAKAGEAKTPPLPKGVLGPKAIKVFLDREIKRYIRYKSPLSCLCLSAAVPLPDGTFRDPTADELVQIATAICGVLTKTLRDLDLIGSLGSLGDNLFLVILSMTDEAGAYGASARLCTNFAELRVVIGGQVIMPAIVLSLSQFEKEATPDIVAYVQTLVSRHRRQHALFVKDIPPEPAAGT